MSVMLMIFLDEPLLSAANENFQRDKLSHQQKAPIASRRRGFFVLVSF